MEETDIISLGLYVHIYDSLISRYVLQWTGISQKFINIM